MKPKTNEQFYKKLAGLQVNEDVAIIDNDCCFDQEMAEEFGVNLEQLLITQPNTLEEKREAVEAMQLNGIYCVDLYCPYHLGDEMEVVS